MLNQAAADRLVDDTIAPGYVRPAYDGHSFGNIPATVASLLGVDIDGRPLSSELVPFERVETVVVVVVDGFGFEQWTRHHAEHEFFARFTERAPVCPITSVFPAETAAAMTTYTTGRMPIEHGLIGWNIPRENTVIESLPFETKDGTDAGEALGIERGALQDGTPIAEQFQEAGVETRHVVPESIVDDGASSLIRLPYEDLDGFSRQLQTAIETTDSGFVHAYLPHVDAVAHDVGTSATAYRSVLSDVSTALARAVDGVGERVGERTLVAVTADHGHVDTTPSENVDLLQFDRVANVIERDTHGTPLLGGGGRNVHFYADGTPPEQIRDVLTAELDTREALVLERETAIDEGLFGPGEPSDVFARQCGDVIVIPREKIVWHGEEPDPLRYTGMHGGLNPREQLVPFAATGLAALRD
ncbi:alkaline phosphatase family protein [Halocatena pleomorpha]|uniref:Alkaline phosphatase family protein n=1 Tax=Halocatena pleomorpha TaxID=1785090 RepID=A0A3P3RBB1_9EURY|nr:alkaline phosphatase family protein [Halocatena pleomorpha]RRJ30752.1 alkaline phosphatase family protein [Halocatena pleomorpha]